MTNTNNADMNADSIAIQNALDSEDYSYSYGGKLESLELRVNGRKYWFKNLTQFRRISRSTYTVDRRGTEYTIEGGRHAGGFRNEWYVEAAGWLKPIRCKSVVDALNMLENM